ncbi:MULTISPECIES: hypothetical protein [Sphingobacterium]|uniref:hypothetical protein n=1 Tax=Sphingobacterium TaxID=28453 RepID=UPI00104E88B4|nr:MULTISPECIES: hypothetical protein [Sphingobacterium]MCW2258957.1 hypothetical protein [Sphingobacterium kitahiroshimense]TCR14590.1 hypothetical protein EDF67_101695 [Sphingobacterium sp. JUb78]
MSNYKHFLDTVFYNIEINEVVERRKCRATGKVRFNSVAEATFFIHWLKWRISKWLEKSVRRKHRNKGFGAKSSTPRYVYSCEFCEGYHITKEHPYDYQQKKEKYHGKYFE